MDGSTKEKKKMNIIRYLKDVKLEMNKVVWPTKNELTADTIIVLFTCGVFAAMFWLIDTGVLAGIKQLF